MAGTIHQDIQKIVNNIGLVIVGKEKTIELVLVALFCRGHLLLEDVPGLGKTTLAKTLAKSINAKFRRIQFTPDLLPADITGTSIYNQKTSEFFFQPGPVFANIVLVDEINRATPRTQSALLECMEEFQVTADGRTYLLKPPYFVMATQNPIEQLGTYPLPEAQLDRFFIKTKIGYPEIQEEVNILNAQAQTHPLEALQAVLEVDSVLLIQEAVKKIKLENNLKEYIVKIVNATRLHEKLILGASPRGSLALARAAQALALVRGQNFVRPDLIKELSYPVLCHRMALKPQYKVEGYGPEKVLREILDTLPVPG